MKELELIDWIRKNAGRPSGNVVLGIGDDCAVLERDGKKLSLLAADMLIEGTHFDLKKDPPEKIGRKAVAVNISDIAAMGGVPEFITVSMGIPRGMGLFTVRKIYKGIFGICREFGVKVVGGDTNGSRCLVIDVCVVGCVEKKRLVKRSGARQGDLILISGPVRDGRKSHLDFVPLSGLSRRLTAKGGVSSMIDVSDGIGPDLGRICRESGVGARIYAAAVPLSKGLKLADALYYGESFELLFTMEPSKAKKIAARTACRGRYPGCFVIGQIVPRSKGVKLVGADGQETPLEMKGFKHI